MKFKVGDRVIWAGVQGVVKGKSQLNPRAEVRIEVEFDAFVYAGRKATEYFFEDGRYAHWHKEPSLKLVE